MHCIETIVYEVIFILYGTAALRFPEFYTLRTDDLSPPDDLDIFSGKVRMV